MIAMQLLALKLFFGSLCSCLLLIGSRCCCENCVEFVVGNIAIEAPFTDDDETNVELIVEILFFLIS